MAQILLLEDDIELADTLNRHLRALGHSVRTAADVHTALFHLSESPVDLLICDVLIRRIDGKMAGGGITLISRLRRSENRRKTRLPIIAISAGFASQTEIRTLHLADQMGADFVLAKPFEMGKLNALVRLALQNAEADMQDISRASETFRARVLLVEDDIELASTLQHALRQAGYFVALASAAQPAMQLLATKSFDLLIADVFLPKNAGDTAPSARNGIALLERCATLANKPAVIVITGGAPDADISSEGVMRALLLGGAGLAKPFTEEALLQLAEQQLAGRPSPS